MLRSTRSIATALMLTAGSLTFMLAPTEAQAFCGFYVSGADQEMFNNATMVVMMREGTKTVLSMRNNYEGPPEGFAMVIPVPQVLEEENVKVLKDEVFTRVDQLAAPRLVEYWERDPCYKPDVRVYEDDGDGAVLEGAMAPEEEPSEPELGVKIEAQFDVGEYNVVILSAKESNGLEKWLEQEKYNIPKGAAPVLKPYIEGGQYFFVAKVDPKKVTFKDGQAQLSPLRFHYDSKEFSLPVRLGLLNAKGHQDLLVHILAKKQRYEVANYKNVTIPTNILVKDHVRDRFAEFYATLLDRTLEENPKAVITEYSWDASTCDPCPVPALRPGEMITLGLDVVDGSLQEEPAIRTTSPPSRRGRSRRTFRRPRSSGWVLTRLHARYTKDELEEDLVFRKADPIIGGRGTPHGENPKMNEEGAKPGSYNNFQGRYIMLNPWEGEIKCENPRRGVWGGPPGSSKSAPPKTKAAADTAFVQRGKFELKKAFAQEKIPGLQLMGGKPEDLMVKNAKEDAPANDTTAKETTPAETSATTPEASKPAEKKEEKKSNCASTGTPDVPASPLALMLLGLIGLMRRRER
jgi:MYXO-CTERM domain-containing protein